MADKNQYFYGLGRRKSATARVRLQSGKGTITVNGKPAEEYFAESGYLLNELNKPFTVLDQEDLFELRAKAVACELAFSLGDKDTLARLITERAAGYDWRAARR